MRRVADSTKSLLVVGSTPIILAALLCAIVLLSNLGSDSLQLEVTTMLIFVVTVVGLYIFIGNTGVQSFGHVSFMAIGAYLGALVTIPAATKEFLLPSLPSLLRTAEVSPTVGVLIGAAGAAVFAAIIAAPLMRLNGIAASIAMLAVLIIVNVVLSEADSITRGVRSLTGIPLVADKSSCLLWAIGAILVAFAYQRSRWGLRVRATREDEFAAGAAGIRIPWERSIALVLSGAVMGAGGMLYGESLGTINPATFYLDMTVLTLVMLIVGGVRSLTGAVVGTVVVFALSELLRNIENGVNLGVVSIPGRPGLELIGISLAALAILIWRPQGVTGGREVDLAAIRRAASRVGAIPSSARRRLHGGPSRTEPTEP
jgi:branched-chain amino acid transport system permease protein